MLRGVFLEFLVPHSLEFQSVPSYYLLPVSYLIVARSQYQLAFCLARANHMRIRCGTLGVNHL